MPCLAAMASAALPMWWRSKAHQRPSCTVASSSSPLPRRMPRRACGSRCGPRLMLSMPPATTTAASPRRTARVASITACSPEAQTLFSVMADAVGGMPAASAACRAGAWPTPAWTTLPSSTSSTASGGTPARASAARTATAPSWGAGTSASAPRKRPIGVRAAPTRYASLIAILPFSRLPKSGGQGAALLQPQPAGDHEPLNLRRALADREDLRVAVEARDRRLFHVAVAAMHLQAYVRGAHRQLGGEELRHGGGLAERLAAVAQ